MLGVKYFQKVQINLPKVFTQRIINEKDFKVKFSPFLLGSLTFFLPCGLTLSVQTLVLISGGFWQGASMMFVFVLGTIPGLLAIGFSAVKFSEKNNLRNKFLKLAGILVLFFCFI